MTNTRLVLLHIPKTAGTSFRETVKSIYGEDKMHWYGNSGHAFGDRIREYRYSPKQVAGKLILGGHKPLGFYPASADNIYCSTVRDPAERVKSLFSYYTRPEVAGSEGDFAERQNLRERWIKKGIVPESLLQSIECCPSFRKEVANVQCRYLSRGGNTFKEVCKTLNRGNFLIGDSKALPRIVDELGLLLHWPERDEIIGNRSKPGSNDDILQEPGVMERIRMLCDQDFELYEFICSENEGLFRNLAPGTELAVGDLRCTDVLERAFSRLAWRKVSLCAEENFIQPGSEESEVAVTVHNASREYLRRYKKHRVTFSYVLLDEAGEIIPFEGKRTPLRKVLGPGESYTERVRVTVPSALYNRVKTIRISLVVEGKMWVYKTCPGHGLDIELMSSAG